ncbi:Nucleolar protein [Taphrina deformans PYCC 5710]|uniref:Nucleolar protein 12 n=1 Tax=Taphrina deformans (strain PYCC 5710 / ATCC 11124 / CBS 356.35 / IMI 108563 / JCM 9778 / NBRC 8474) TaxID=1097556 RepID=R4XFN3_TAPDE|nr:Nucleolar protein [Taphrina deformans PYCC 5710]|eukprot:CCG83297.1 Nucleolar protein [Taphrina deformans PYCC 5710]
MDPSLSALFAQSAGPVQKPVKKDRTIIEPLPITKPQQQSDAEAENPSDGPASTEPSRDKKKKQKKRKRDDVLLEDLYMSKLAEHPTKIAKSSDKKREEAKKNAIKPLGESESEDEPPKDQTSSAAADRDAANSSDSGSDSDAEGEQANMAHETTTGASDANGANMQHETQQRQDRELEKAKATVFVGNLPTSVISSHTDYKALKALFSEYGKVRSIRFRSIAFSELLPRKVAFVQGKFHPERDTLNAYVVFADATHARSSIALNGHLFLNRKHIRVDSVAHPAVHVNKRCVFVGSLPFDAEEELLWTHFAACGAIESVRVIRDKKTNVGKGFAYVQFKDASSVQNALLLNDKKMLLGEGKGARKLRVTKSSAMPSKHKADQRERDQLANPDLKPRDKAKLGRVKNLMGSQAAVKLKLMQREIAMEGERARAPHGERTRKKKKKSKKDTLRSKARAAAYRKADAGKATKGAE